MDFIDDYFGPIILVTVIGLTAVCCIALYKNDKQEQAQITQTCSSYLADSRTHSDSLHARMACDQLWSNKQTKDMATAATIMAASASANAAASASYRR